MLYMDGSLNSKGNTAGIILEGPDDMVLVYSLKFDFKVINN